MQGFTAHWYCLGLRFFLLYWQSRSCFSFSFICQSTKLTNWQLKCTSSHISFKSHHNFKTHSGNALHYMGAFEICQTTYVVDLIILKLIFWKSWQVYFLQATQKVERRNITERKFTCFPFYEIMGATSGVMGVNEACILLGRLVGYLRESG